MRGSKLGRFGFGKNALAMLIEDPPFFGQRQTARRSIEEPDAQPFLEYRNSLADRRSGQIEFIGCCREASGSDDMSKYRHPE